jgi:hypothetical protein
MPVEFDVDRLRVQRFRGIVDFDLSLSRGTPTYLIGGNNTRKSTLLNAFALALRSGGFHTFTPTEFDFHQDRGDGRPCDDFAITVAFKAQTPQHLPAVQGVGNPIPVHGVRVLGRRKSGALDHRHVLLDSKGKPIVLSPRTTLKGKVKEEYRDHGLGWSPYYARLDEIRDFLPEVWLLRPDNVDASLYHWKTGPLNRLARLLSDKFLDTAWTFDHDGQNRPMPAALAEAHRFLKASVQRFPFWADELKPKLEAAFSKYLGQAATFGLMPDVQSLKDWLTQQLVTSFAAEVGAPLIPLSANGDGWQALTRLAALEILQDLSPRTSPIPVLILFEEPETYLHPHLRRKLRDVLEGLASRGWIVLVSTHAPEFISFRRPQQVVRLWPRSADHGRLLTSGVSDEVRFQERLDERGNHELLFANRVILCEGQDDFTALNTYFEKAHVDVDGFGATILDLGGVQNMPLYAKMARDLRIPWCVLTDEDLLADGTTNPRTEGVRLSLPTLLTPSDALTMWPGSLEATLGVPSGKATPRWQDIHLVPKSLAQIRVDHPEFVRVADQIAQWLTGH